MPFTQTLQPQKKPGLASPPWWQYLRSEGATLLWRAYWEPRSVNTFSSERTSTRRLKTWVQTFKQTLTLRLRSKLADCQAGAGHHPGPQS